MAEAKGQALAPLRGCRIRAGADVWTVTDTLLGKGGFASVWAAEAPNGSLAAVKCVDLRRQTAWAQSKLKQEAILESRTTPHSGPRS